MRTALLAINLALLSFSAVAHQTGSAVPPPFQAKRLPPEKMTPHNSSETVTPLSDHHDVLPPPAGRTQLPVGSGITVPAGFKPRTDVQLSKTAQDAVQMSEKWMAEHNQPLAGQDGRVLYSYGAGLPTVVCAPLRVCIIELQSGEKLAGEPHIGDSVRWNVSPAMFGHGDSATTLIVLKPQIAGLDTNLLITTDRRAYYLRLLSKPEDYVARVAFSYPDDEYNSSAKWQEEIARQKQQEQKSTIAELPKNPADSLYFDYRIKAKSQAIKPVRVFDDGQKTFIQISAESRTHEAPVLVVIGADGKQEMVNYRVKGDMYIVDRLFERAELILGSGKKAQKVEIERERKS
ncbi:MAG TPA: P-type conjugative transfer protein TrbG [Bryobacteraceae bacterium]|jgi:type IV secretion system protein VirB9|nr:P-type conjugative transfer protein TrbG [Bryobacteraceae bacterium]